MNCPNCNQENPAASKYCQSCGQDLSVIATMSQPVAGKCPNCGESNPAENRFCLHCGHSLSSNIVQPMNPAPSRATATQIGQLGAGGQSALNIWGPFAGYGQRGRHVSWLLNELGDKAEPLHEIIQQRFQQREVPGTRIDSRTMVAKGLLVERRPYYLFQRGITTAALYVARFGRDLYISQVTYVKGPFSNLRIAIVALLALFALFYTTIYPAMLLDRLGAFNFLSSNSEFPFFLLCIMGPVGFFSQLAFLLILIFSVYKWLRERDFLAILRQPPNEFDQDDALALEKAVEDTVRQGLDTLDIDVNLMPPATERSFGSQPRLI